MRIALVRQRPSIGDCLLLGPLVQAVKAKHPDSHLTVVTDSSYMCGALPLIFEHMEGIDRIECVSGAEWTTLGNKRVDSAFHHVPDDDIPYSVKRADLVLDCNGAFIEFEREYHGNPPYGISEFWLKHFDLHTETADLLPHYRVTDAERDQVKLWLEEQRATDKPLLGIVMRAGDPVRNWDRDNWSGLICDWAYTQGMVPVTIDPTLGGLSQYCVRCVGQRLDFVAALLERCRVVLTPDTGLLHLAQAVGTRTVSLWGIMDPMLRVKGYDSLMVPQKSHGFCSAQDKECRCWAFQRWSCIHRLTLREILNGLEEALHG